MRTTGMAVILLCLVCGFLPVRAEYFRGSRERWQARGDTLKKGRMPRFFSSYARKLKKVQGFLNGVSDAIEKGYEGVERNRWFSVVKGLNIFMTDNVWDLDFAMDVDSVASLGPEAQVHIKRHIYASENRPFLILKEQTSLDEPINIGLPKTRLFLDAYLFFFLAIARFLDKVLQDAKGRRSFDLADRLYAQNERIQRRFEMLVFRLAKLFEQSDIGKGQKFRSPFYFASSDRA